MFTESGMNLPLLRDDSSLYLWHDLKGVMHMIGKRITELRRRKGPTQSQLAKLIGSNTRSIRNWEDDVTDPNLESVCKLLHIFNVSANELLGQAKPDVIDISPLDEENKHIVRSILQVIVDSDSKRKKQATE